MKQFKELGLFIVGTAAVDNTLLLRRFIEIVPLNAGILTTKKELAIGCVYNAKDVTYIVT